MCQAKEKTKQKMKYVVHRNEWIWGRTWVIIAEDGAGIVKVSEDEDDVVLSGLSVLPDHRGKGIGTSLIREAERIVREEIGDADICLSVESQNKDLIEWYERLGYYSDVDQESDYADLVKYCARE